jgi:hypothetical protein
LRASVDVTGVPNASTKTYFDVSDLRTQAKVGSALRLKTPQSM